MLASFTEYTERDDLQLLLWTFCNQNGDIALVCSKTMGGNTVALAIRTPGPQDDFAKEVARIMSNVAASNGKRMQCTVDIKSLQPWSVGVSGIPYMVGVAEELLRLATFTTEFDIKAVIADRAVYCFEVVCEHVQKELRGTENEFTMGSRKLRHDQQPRSDIQTFSNILGLGQKFVDEVLTIRAGGSSLVAYWLTCRPGEASENGQRWWYGHHGDPKLFATFTALVDMKGDWMRNMWDAQRTERAYLLEGPKAAGRPPADIPFADCDANQLTKEELV